MKSDVESKVKNKKIQFPSTRQIDPMLLDLLKGCLAKKPSQRYSIQDIRYHDVFASIRNKISLKNTQKLNTRHSLVIDNRPNNPKITDKFREKSNSMELSAINLTPSTSDSNKSADKGTRVKQQSSSWNNCVGVVSSFGKKNKRDSTVVEFRDAIEREFKEKISDKFLKDNKQEKLLDKIFENPMEHTQFNPYATSLHDLSQISNLIFETSKKSRRRRNEQEQIQIESLIDTYNLDSIFSKKKKSVKKPVH